MKQFLITPAAGKMLIAKSLASYPPIKEILTEGTLAIIAGTTNGYLAQEILSNIQQTKGFSRKKFFRGVALPPGQPVTDKGRLPNETTFPGDVIIKNGRWQRGATIFEVVDDLKEGDIIVKGANALNLPQRQAGILIGDPRGGTIVAALQAVLGRRVRLILPVGLEKRVLGDLNELARKLNSPGGQGPRLLPVTGDVFTEIEAISLLTGAKAQQVAGGGVNGAEGSIWLAVSGTQEQVEAARKLLTSISGEPPFKF